MCLGQSRKLSSVGNFYWNIVKPPFHKFIFTWRTPAQAKKRIEPDRVIEDFSPRCRKGWFLIEEMEVKVPFLNFMFNSGTNGISGRADVAVSTLNSLLQRKKTIKVVKLRLVLKCSTTISLNSLLQRKKTIKAVKLRLVLKCSTTILSA